MSWTYSGNPKSSDVDMVRYRLGDIDPDNPIATDEECLQALDDERGNSYLAAALLAETRAMSFVWRPARVKRGDYVIEYAQQADAFRTLAQSLRMQASIRATTVYAGGISEADKEATRRDADRVRPFARVRLHDSDELWRPLERED